MDRLPPLIAIAIALTGCDDASARGPAPLPSRVVAVTAAEDEAEDLCDVAPSAGQGPVLAFPPLASGSAPAAPTRPRWVNVWATWCRPCVEEMPMIVEWAARMRGDQAEVDLVFVSADASDEAVAAFRASHPSAPDTLRVADPQALQAWVTTVGLDAGATLPIHVITDAEGRVRCARTGAVSEDDYDAMRDLVRGLSSRTRGDRAEAAP